MKKCLISLAALAVMGMVSQVALSQDRLGETAVNGEVRKPGSRPAKSRVDRKAVLEKVIKEMGLPADKDASVKQTIESLQQSRKDWLKENAPKFKELREQLVAARKAGQKDKVKELLAQRAKLMEGMRSVDDAAMKKLGEVLTADQLAKVKGVLMPGRMRPRGPVGGPMFHKRLENLGLSEDQKAAVAKILEDAKAKAQQADKPADKRKIWKDAGDNIKTNVLTKEQVEKLQARPKGAPRMFPAMESLKLTDEQTTQIEKIKADTKEAVKNAEGPKAKREVMQAALKKIHDEVLTDEQRKIISEARKHKRGPRGGHDRPKSAPSEVK